jgi:hypothetical protein
MWVHQNLNGYYSVFSSWPSIFLLQYVAIQLLWIMKIFWTSICLLFSFFSFSLSSYWDDSFVFLWKWRILWIIFHCVSCLGLAMKINVTFGPQKVLSWNLKEVCSCLLLTFISLNGTIIYDTEIMDVKRQVS